MQLAAVAEQLKDGDGAIALYRRIPDSSPLKELSDLQLGLNLADLDRNAEAIAHLKAFVDAHPDGQLVAAGFDDGQVVLYDAASRRELRRWQAHSRLPTISGLKVAPWKVCWV